MRTEHEIRMAIDAIRGNAELTYGYREDTIRILYWVLGANAFDGLPDTFNSTAHERKERDGTKDNQDASGSVT